MRQLREMVVMQGRKVESARRGRSQPPTGRRGERTITAFAVYQTFNFSSVSGRVADASQLPDSVVEPERGMRRLPVGNPDQVIVAVTVNVFRINAPRLQRFEGKMQARRPAGTECELNAFLETVGDQFSAVGESVAVKVRDGLRGKRERDRQWGAVQGGRFLPGTPWEAQNRGRRQHKKERQFSSETASCLHLHCPHAANQELGLTCLRKISFVLFV